jgi:uncharacterized protein (TIGR03083 family)
MITSIKSVEDIAPLEHDEAMDRAEVEVGRLLRLVDALTEEQWAQPTDCTGWSVKDIVAHLVGMWQLQTDPADRTRQISIATERAARNGTLRLDELTALQVAEHAHLPVGELRDALRDAAPRALASRRALPPEVRATPYDPQLPGEQRWTLGYLFDVVHTRDPWMHRVDITRATGRELELTEDHDGRIVENVVADWAGRHGQPFRLELTNPAGGIYQSGDDGADLALDAVEFCRILSGRARANGLLTTPVVF